MSANGVLTDVERNPSSMANTILSTKRGRHASSSASGEKWPSGKGNARHVRGSKRSHTKATLVMYDHCCGIHGAARERKGIKKGTSAARRRYDKGLVEKEMEQAGIVPLGQNLTHTTHMRTPDVPVR